MLISHRTIDLKSVNCIVECNPGCVCFSIGRQSFFFFNLQRRIVSNHIWKTSILTIMRSLNADICVVADNGVFFRASQFHVLFFQISVRPTGFGELPGVTNWGTHNTTRSFRTYNFKFLFRADFLINYQRSRSEINFRSDFFRVQQIQRSLLALSKQFSLHWLR